MSKQDNEQRLAKLKNIVLSMPEKPGSYQYYDENHTIIYVGKAKNLKRRVSSYFHKEVDRYKTKVLVSKIHDISSGQYRRRRTTAGKQPDQEIQPQIQRFAERRQDLPFYLRNQRAFPENFQNKKHQQARRNILRTLSSHRKHVCST